VPSRADEVTAAGLHARELLEATHVAREVTLTASRRAIRSCAVAIRAVHRSEFDLARRHIGDAAALLAEADDATEGHPDIRFAGFLHDAQKEFAEANLTLAFVSGTALPSPGGLGVATAAYLNGMAEAASELRRQILDRLRTGQLDVAEELFAAMDEVYGMLVTIDYPEAITAGLRRSTDALRAVLERTRGDVTSAVIAARVQAAVEHPRSPPH
jgi:translin